MEHLSPDEIHLQDPPHRILIQRPGPEVSVPREKPAEAVLPLMTKAQPSHSIPSLVLWGQNEDPTYMEVSGTLKRTSGLVGLWKT